MKRFIFAMMLSAFAISMQAQTGVENSNPIDFQVGWHDEGAPTVPIKRSPVRPPKASLSGHTLYILTSHADYTLQLLSFDGTVVFETFVPSSVNEVQLPANLTGDYELQLQTQRFIFTGEVEL